VRFLSDHPAWERFVRVVCGRARAKPSTNGSAEELTPRPAGGTRGRDRRQCASRDACPPCLHVIEVAIEGEVSRRTGTHGRGSHRKPALRLGFNADTRCLTTAAFRATGPDLRAGKPVLGPVPIAETHRTLLVAPGRGEGDRACRSSHAAWPVGAAADESGGLPPRWRDQRGVVRHGKSRFTSSRLAAGTSGPWMASAVGSIRSARRCSPPH
jgi:hypothetical protein